MPMNEKVLTLLGGILLGIVFGVFLVSKSIIAVAGTYPWIVAILSSVLMFFGGVLISRKTSKTEPIRFSGRVFEFPQAPIMIEVALTRMGALVPRGEE